MLQLATTAAPPRKRRSRLDDAPFIAALDFAEVRDGPAIARHMLANGTPATLATIKKRMAEFVRYTDAVEAVGQGWRLVAANDDTPLPPSPTPTNAPVNRKACRAAHRVKTIATVPANDNPATALPIGLHHGCGLDLMRSLPDRSIDLVLCDLPYGMTELAIDPKIDVAEWMAEMHRVVTDRGAIVAFAAQPFTTDLIVASQAFDQGVERFFKQALVWEKPQPTGFAQARARHLKAHEDILVFSKGTVVNRSKRQMIYNPQGAEEIVKSMPVPRQMEYMKKVVRGSSNPGEDYLALTNCPRSVLRYAKDSKVHSFAKPTALLEYLIRTYSNENAVVLDPTMGSGSAGVACLATGRQFIGAENGFDQKGRCIFTIAKNRIKASGQIPIAASDDAKPTKPRRKFETRSN